MYGRFHIFIKLLCRIPRKKNSSVNPAVNIISPINNGIPAIILGIFAKISCVSSPKLKGRACAAVIADMHGFSYGRGNRRLLEEVRKLKPHAIFIPGDMLVSKYSGTYEVALRALQELARIAPVYYSYGNHESRLRNPEKANHPLFMQYMSKVKEAGVIVMGTESREICFCLRRTRIR